MSGPQPPHYGYPQQPPYPQYGYYHVHVHTPFFLPSRVGPADYTVGVGPGQWVELEYKAPVWTFSPGSLGPPPQTYNGQAAMVIVTVVALVVAFAAMFVLALAATV
jgi:hypothetical protein